MLMFQTRILFLTEHVSLVPINLHNCWPCEWTRSIVLTIKTKYIILPLNSRMIGWDWSQVSWLYSRLFAVNTCCWVMAWIFCGIHTFTGDVMALEVDEGLPFLEGVVIVSLLPLLPTLPTLPDGDGVGERGDGVPVILKKENTTAFFVKNSCPRLLWLSPTVHSTFFKADNVGNGSKCLSTKGVLLIESKKISRKGQGMTVNVR